MSVQCVDLGILGVVLPRSPSLGVMRSLALCPAPSPFLLGDGARRFFVVVCLGLVL
jgi:hypothetical protein